MENTIDSFLSGTSRPLTRPLPEQVVSLLWNRIALGAILSLSVFMNFFQLGQNGYGNVYYAAAVKSMGDSWQNFFFISSDPGGFVMVDKTPLGLWLQTLSSKFFGFSAFSIFFPQALCGVLAVWLLYYLVRRHFGVVAGLIAALVLAVTPIVIVDSRSNPLDGLLVLPLLLAAWAVIRAAETGKLRWLLLSGVFVGLGFNIKMSQAYLVVPALVMTYLLCAPPKIRTRILHLALFVVVVFTLSISWVLAVELTPAAQRPYVGSTQNNSEVGLTFGYNGLGRLKLGGSGNSAPGQPSGGTLNVLRLFGVSLGGQISWLLPFALLAILALAWQRRFHFQTDRQQLGLVLWGMWLLPMVVFFTLDASFHEYYLNEIAPGIAALVGSGLVIMWKDYRSGGWRGWLLLPALLVTAVAQIYMLAPYPVWSRWLSPLIGILTALVVIALVVWRVRPELRLSASATRIAGIAVSIGLLTLLIAPTVWSGYSVFVYTDASDPVAGPDVAPANLVTASPALISYLEANQGKAKYLVAVPDADSYVGGLIIIAVNKPVMFMGGFSGNDPLLTTKDLQKLISNKTIRFFLVNPPQGQYQPPKGYNGVSSGWGADSIQQQILSSWIGNHCKYVPSRVWGSATENASPRDGGKLYDCESFQS